MLANIVPDNKIVREAVSDKEAANLWHAVESGKTIAGAKKGDMTSILKLGDF